MLIEHEWQSYNHKRYGTPWVAAITFDGVKPVYDFTLGRFASGRLVFEAEPGQLVAMGQKDYRGNGTEKFFGMVTETGEVETISEKRALDLYREREQRDVQAKQDAQPSAYDELERVRKSLDVLAVWIVDLKEGGGLETTTVMGELVDEMRELLK